MSVKILDSFRFSGALHRAFARLNDLRPQVDALARQGYLQVVARAIEVRVDRRVLAGKRVTWTLYLDVVKEISSALNSTELHGIRQPKFDWGCEVVLLPFEGGTLGIVYAEQRLLTDLVLGIEGFEPFDYQNACDPPETITESEWAVRRDSWAAVTEGFTRSPGEVGARVQMAPSARPGLLSKNSRPTGKRLRRVREPISSINTSSSCRRSVSRRSAGPRPPSRI